MSYVSLSSMIGNYCNTQGYQNSSQVTSAITGYGYQNSSQVNSLCGNYGYSKSSIETMISTNMANAGGSIKVISIDFLVNTLGYNYIVNYTNYSSLSSNTTLTDFIDTSSFNYQWSSYSYKGTYTFKEGTYLFSSEVIENYSDSGRVIGIGIYYLNNTNYPTVQQILWWNNSGRSIIVNIPENNKYFLYLNRTYNTYINCSIAKLA